MAVYKIFPTKDATIYSLYPNKNTGLDEIIETSLEIGNSENPFPQTSRFLIKYDTNDITNVINNLISGSEWKSNLRCFIATGEAISSDTTLEVYPISQSWDMGNGKYSFIPEIQNGVSWIWRNYTSGSMWETSSYSPGTTGSYSTSSSMGGGTWYVTQSLSGSQVLSYYSDKDINIDVTNIVKAWYSASIENEGFIIKQKEEFIDNINVQPKIKYFSVDSNTIYPPYLEFMWENNIFSTGSSSLPILNDSQCVITIGENLGQFYNDSISKFRVYSRPEYPARTFQTSSYYVQNYYLPDNSYYAIKDLYTNEYVIDFSNYTKLSRDETSSYFNIYMNGLQPERYYTILIKIEIDGQTIIFNDNYNFKIING